VVLKPTATEHNSAPPQRQQRQHRELLVGFFPEKAAAVVIFLGFDLLVLNPTRSNCCLATQSGGIRVLLLLLPIIISWCQALKGAVCQTSAKLLMGAKLGVK